jgi:hypothetical protein
LWALSDQLPELHTIGETLPACRLIPAWDNYMLGYTSRDFAVPSGYDSYIRPGGGIIAPALLIDGKILGTWKLVKRGRKLSLQLTTFRPLADSELAAIEADVSEIPKFMGSESQIPLVLDQVNS